jgi:hypothetical protein
MKWGVGAYSRLLQVSALEEGQYPLLSKTAEDSYLYTKDSKSLSKSLIIVYIQHQVGRSVNVQNYLGSTVKNYTIIHNCMHFLSCLHEYYIPVCSSQNIA